MAVTGSLLPQILLDKNRAIEVSTSETYRNYVIIYICGIPGVMVGALMYGVPLVGRQWGMVVSSALMGASLFLFSAINTEASNIGINIMEYFFQSMFNASGDSLQLDNGVSMLTCLQDLVRLDS